MSSSGSVTYWIAKLQAGDEAAAQPLWECYFGRLARLARTRLQGLPRRAADEEDVALSALASFCRGVKQGRFPRLSDRTNLWPLLVQITVRKAADLVNHERRKKRGGGKVRGGSALIDPNGSSATGGGLDQVVGREPTPEFGNQLAEECQRLLGLLGDDELRSVALWKMEGYTNDEIAAKLGCVPRTVERKLHVIRTRWAKEIVP